MQLLDLAQGPLLAASVSIFVAGLLWRTLGLVRRPAAHLQSAPRRLHVQGAVWGAVLRHMLPRAVRRVHGAAGGAGMIDRQMYTQFGNAIAHLAEQAPQVDLPDAERVQRAKEVMRQKIDRNLAVDLQACVRCGSCADASQFSVQSDDPGLIPHASST